MSPWTDLKSTGVGCMANLTDINHCLALVVVLIFVSETLMSLDLYAT